MRTHLGRSIDPRYPAVAVGLALASLAGLAGIGYRLQQGDDLATAFGFAFNVGVATFLAWAIGRELDPDRPVVAAVAAVLAAPLTWWAGPAALGTSVIVLMIGRVTARTVGPPLLTIDQAGLLALVGFFSTTGAAWVAALGLSFAVARDVRLPGSTSRLQLGTALLIAGVATARWVIAGPETGEAWTIPLAVVAGVALVLAVTAPVIALPMSVTDIGSQPLHPVRLQSARRQVLVATGLALIVGGAGGVGGLAPVLGALAAIRLPREDPS